VGGLISGLLLSIFLLPTLYAWVAREGDVLPVAEDSFVEGHT
jgi:cobalt-zinc-cadmium resistance protein CzcA